MSTRPLKVLLIEDNPGDTRLIQQLLAEAGNVLVTLDCADSLSTGLKRLAVGGIDVILLDLSLPESQGLETFAAVYAHAAHQPIIVLTGLDDEDMGMAAVRAGAQDYLIKAEVNAGYLLVRSLRYAIERKKTVSELKALNESLEQRVAERTSDLEASRTAALNMMKDAQAVRKKAEQTNAALTREIVERKRAEERLRGTRARLQYLFDSNPSVIYTTEGSGDFRCTFVSENFQSIMGYAPREMLDDPRFWVTHLHPQDAPRVLSKVHAMIAEGGATLEYRFQHRDGHHLWIQDTFKVMSDDSGKPVEIVRSWTDITEQKRVEQALRRLEKAVETMQLGVTITDTTGKILYSNPAEASMHSYAVDELVGKDVRIFAPRNTWNPMDLDRIRDMNGWRRQSINLRKDGSTFPVHLISDVVTNAAGEPIGIVTSCEDITERQRAEEALRESKRRLEETLAELKQTQQEVLRQERLRALGQMASGIAHDFNNALMPILGFTDVLLDCPEHLDDKEKVTHYLQTIHTAARDAAYVVRRLREFYRPVDENEIFLPADLNRLVEQAIMLTQPRWKDQLLASGITIRIEPHLQKIPLVAGNETELREAVTNLIFNAVDAMPEGGTLTFHTRPEAADVVLEITDTGTGMTHDVRQRCLEPFFSTKGEGTGLGLAMVYGIIQRHRGSIDIESEPGKGTTFILRLPIRTKPEARVKEKEAKAPSRRLRVLVVDDEPPVRDVLVEYLTRDGHAVETATNGREALQKFHGGWFDVVLTDKAMPEMSGDQLATIVKRLAPNKSVILLTGFGDLIEASNEKTPNVDWVVSKPVSLTGLRQALAQATAG